MTQRQHNEFSDRKALSRAGWAVSKRDCIAFNSGSERENHIVGKALLGQILKDHGFRVDSEVEYEATGRTADLLAYGHESRGIWVVELENNYSKDLALKNLERYCRGPVTEVFTLEPPAEDTPIVEAKEQLATELFGEP